MNEDYDSDSESVMYISSFNSISRSSRGGVKICEPKLPRECIGEDVRLVTSNDFCLSNRMRVAHGDIIVANLAISTRVAAPRRLGRDFPRREGLVGSLSRTLGNVGKIHYFAGVTWNFEGNGERRIPRGGFLAKAICIKQSIKQD